MTTRSNIVGLNGNNAPPLIDNIPARLWLGIQARVFTAYRREPGDLTFGLGLANSFDVERVSQPVLRRRVQQSFATLDGAEARRYVIDVAGGLLDVTVDIETPEHIREGVVVNPTEVPLPALDFPDLPDERWARLWAPAPMQTAVDFWPGWFAAFAVTLDPDLIDASLLPALALGLDAFAFDHDGPGTQQRRALRFAKQLHALVGTEAAFDLLMELNATSGVLRYIGDYDAAGQHVARDADGRRQGEYSSVSMDRETEHNPDGSDTAPVDQESLVHLYVAIDIIRAPDRIGDHRFVDYITRAARRTLPYTLEIAEVNVIEQSVANVRVVTNSRAVRTEYTIGGQLWH